MKVSIITVCYNSAATLEKTILSVINQTYSNIEYIIIDGNSNDSSVQLIKSYQERITKWISEPDKGLYDAINKGIKYATGDIIGLLNSDDTFQSNKVIDEIVSFHTSNLIDASIGNILQHNKEGNILRFYTSKFWNPEKLKIGSMPPHPSIFIKRTLFDNYGLYSTDFKIAADYELITRYFLKNKINWKYSGITTTSMLIGGVSSSGLKSYFRITKEITKALKLNHISANKWVISGRFIWKIADFFYK